MYILMVKLTANLKRFPHECSKCWFHVVSYRNRHFEHSCDMLVQFGSNIQEISLKHQTSCDLFWKENAQLYTAYTCTHKHSLPLLHRLLFLKRCLLFQSASQHFYPSSTSRRRGPLNYTRRRGRSQWVGPQGRKNPLPLSLMISVSQLEIPWSAHRVSQL